MNISMTQLNECMGSLPNNLIRFVHAKRNTANVEMVFESR